MGSTKTTQQQTSSQNSLNTYNPTQNSQVTDFRNSLYPQISGMFAQASQPVYGQAQYAGQLQNLNQLANSSINTLQSRIAGSGGNLNGGGFGAGVANILQNRNNQASAYSMQVPALNQQARLASQLQVGGLANSVAGPALTTSTSQGSNTGTQDSTTTQSQSPLGIISSLLGAGLGFATGGVSGGLSGLTGLLKGTGPQSNATINPFSGYNGGGVATNSPGSYGYQDPYQSFNYNPMGAFGG